MTKFGELKKKQQTALVTGATGFIGGHLVRHLRKLGWEVHALARCASSNPDIANSATWHKYLGDYESVSLAVAISQPDVVFHLASHFLTEHRPEEVERLVDSNLRFGMYLLEAMRQHNARRLINTGSCWQHYDGAEYDPVNLYAATKQAFEAIVDYYISAYNLKACDLKLHDTFGPGDNRKKILDRLTEIARTGATLEMSTGYQRLILLHVDDVTEAYVLLANMLLLDNSIESKRKSYALTTAEDFSIRDLVREVENHTKQKLNVKWGTKRSSVRLMLSPPRNFSPPAGWTQSHRLSDYLYKLFPDK
jgi:nucleoside-diphosphate-sugar epimerase